MFHENQQIGNYTLIRKLGRGGFGEVWLANDEDKYFAVKLPHKDQVDWKQITQEIGLWTLCGKHPNLMPLVGARNFNGQIAIISEYAPDGSLEDLLKEKGKLSEIEAVEMTIGILEGLQHLHESGIIHRDLKPANILLDGKTPRLTDFGISRIITADSLSETISGTWAYMAPECFDGKRNIQTDVWSVGVILYLMLTGNLPFPQKEKTALIAAIIMLEPEPLPDSIALALQNIVSKALTKKSALRCQTTNQMHDELLNFLQTYLTNQKNNFDVNGLTTSEIITQKQIQLIPYRKGSKWGFSDSNKKLIIEAKYDDANRFVEGLAVVGSNGKFGFDFGYIDKTGKVVIPLEYHFASSFSEGLAKVLFDDKWGFIDKTGKIIIPLNYYSVSAWSESGSFSEGLALVRLGKKYGFINKAKIFIPLEYDNASSFSEGLAGVSSNDKWGFIDKAGKVVIPLEYDSVNSFSEGLALVRLGKKYGFIDKTRKTIISLKYDRAYSFSGGLANVSFNENDFYIDKNGTEYYEP